jgi:hypothetical protein
LVTLKSGLTARARIALLSGRGYGVGLTGALKANIKEDMAESSRMIVLWLTYPRNCLCLARIMQLM